MSQCLVFDGPRLSKIFRRAHKHGKRGNVHGPFVAESRQQKIIGIGADSCWRLHRPNTADWILLRRTEILRWENSSTAGKRKQNRSWKQRVRVKEHDYQAYQQPLEFHDLPSKGRWGRCTIMTSRQFDFQLLHKTATGHSGPQVTQHDAENLLQPRFQRSPAHCGGVLKPW